MDSLVILDVHCIKSKLKGAYKMNNVGRPLYGYCEGYFGRDSYRDKRIEAEGYDWIVVRDADGDVLFASFSSGDEKQQSIDSWAKENLD